MAEAPAAAARPLKSVGLQVHIADREHFGAALRLAAGSAAHLNGLRVLAEKKEMSLEEDGLHKGRARPTLLRTEAARGAAKSSGH